MLAEAEEEVTEETMSPGSLLMERDMMGWCMWTPLPPGRSPLCQGAGVQQGCCPHSTLPWCSSNSFSLSSLFLTPRPGAQAPLPGGWSWDNNHVTSCPMAVRCMRLGLAGATAISSSTNGAPLFFTATLFSISQLLCFWIFFYLLYLVYLLF